MSILEEAVMPVETVTIPKAALDWLMGAGPDPAGLWFGDFPEDHPKPAGAFWWRKSFSDILAYYSALSGIPATGSGETVWQDIATAPKDGTWLDLWAGDRRVPDVRWAENDGPDEYGFTGGWVNVKGEFALGEDEPPMFWMRVERPSPANPAEAQAGEVGK